MQSSLFEELHLISHSILLRLPSDTTYCASEACQNIDKYKVEYKDPNMRALQMQPHAQGFWKPGWKMRGSGLYCQVCYSN